jgi:hypothetical protein
MLVSVDPALRRFLQHRRLARPISIIPVVATQIPRIAISLVQASQWVTLPGAHTASGEAGEINVVGPKSIED